MINLFLGGFLKKEEGEEKKKKTCPSQGSNLHVFFL
jgi:hypothetical protein